MISAYCPRCLRFFPWKSIPSCEAFPDGIPERIITGEVAHLTPYPGDHGVQYLPKNPRKYDRAMVQYIKLLDENDCHDEFGRFCSGDGNGSSFMSNVDPTKVANLENRGESFKKAVSVLKKCDPKEKFKIRMITPVGPMTSKDSFTAYSLIEVFLGRLPEETEFVLIKDGDKILNENPCHDELGRFCSGGASKLDDINLDVDSVKPSYHNLDIASIDAFGENNDNPYYEAAKYYTGVGFVDMNNFMVGRINDIVVDDSEEVRKKILKPIEEKCKLLDEALSKTKLPEDVITYRGIKAKAVERLLESGGAVAGNVITNKIFMSSSLDKSVAETFAGKVEQDIVGNKKTLIELRLPKGTHAAYVGKISDLPDEYEVIIKPGVKFKVLGMKESEKERIVVWRAIT